MAENQKAKNLLDWQPQFGGYEGLREGLKKTIEWFTIPANLKTYKSDKYNV